MQLSTKMTLVSLASIGMLIAILLVVTATAMRHFSIATAKEHARIAAEIVRVHLTEAMINGVINKRASFLSRLSTIPGLREAHVIRGPQVAAKFGEGLSQEQTKDQIETNVLSTGNPYYSLIDGENNETLFRATIPFIAQSGNEAEGEPNCIRCHQVNPGSVLGAITLTVSIESLREEAIWTIASVVSIVATFSLLLVVFLRRQIRPVAETAAGVQRVVEQAANGDFSGSIRRMTNDELGDIAVQMNNLMSFLNEGLTLISNKVTRLIEYDLPPNANMLTTTIEIVDGLVQAAQFKQSIEEDETKLEVYERLGRKIEEQLTVHGFSVYEASSDKNRMISVIVDGIVGGPCRWCDPQILVRSESCRVRRTGHVVDSTDIALICTAFRGKGEEPNLEHICLPIIQSGSVGSVIQLVLHKDQSNRIRYLLTLFRIYLREAAPVIEAKRLMDTLRESSLRDPLTGLNNRRFLEEYVDALVAGTQRRQLQISILMLDVDFFKRVNDTYGHEAGDTVIKGVSNLIRKNVRASDIVVRYGGEEFLAVLQDTAPGGGDAVAEKIRAEIETTRFHVPGHVLQKTISIGVADFPTDSDTFWQVVKFADVALYQAKENGRNRVIHFKSEMWKESEEY